MNESGFQTADDRDKVRKTLQSKAKHKVLIIEGPEINEDRYSKLMAISKSCKPGSSCTGMQIQETIQNLFTPYMAEIARQFREGLFIPWVPFLQNLLLISNDFNTASQNLGSPFIGLRSRFTYAIQVACIELGSCDGPAVSSFFKQVGDIINNTELIYVMSVPETSKNLLTTYIKEAQDANDLAEALPDESASADLFRGGEIKTVQDLFKNGTQHQGTPRKRQNDNLLQQIIMMKNVMKGNIQGHLYTMKTAFERCDDSIAKSSFGPGKSGVVMEPSAIGYQRWTKIPEMAMPCSKQTTKTFNKSGFTKTFSLTEYSKCMVEGATAYYPKLQIPYIRLTL
ncbi:hypothetical protein FAGAP_6649 [Fusarium agapanthi]|uniref:Uncharacterized protein n=1 Tax=Fusarium agapanthi TaxID=1803897 RepID=A0A9P5B7T0_9HYPO|nr:hypothetical protein FAGAP_6649 [Fusarium agapanthi]